MPPSLSHEELKGKEPIRSATAAKEASAASKPATKEKKKGRSIASPSPQRQKRPYTPPRRFQSNTNLSKAKSTPWSLSQLTTYIVEHQISLSFTLLSALASVHLAAPADSDIRRTTQKFFTISFKNPNTGLYSKGHDDAYFISFWVVNFTFIRAVLMDYVFIPFARYNGISKKGSIRFGEQAWSFFYAGVFWTLGMCLMYNSQYWMNFKELWTDWPVRETTGTFKWYYLTQLAFWIQQIFVLNIEEKRKDFYQMLTHHIVTSVLISGSYAVHMMRVGNAILCVMDIVDILLPLAKMLKYLKFQKACDAAFGVFLVTWFFTRHIIFLKVIFSAQSDLPSAVTYGCYKMSSDKLDGTAKEIYTPVEECSLSLLSIFFNPQATAYFSGNILNAFLALLWMLEGITLMWFCMIMRVAVKVIRGGEAEDSRSDDEEEAEVEEMEADEAAMHELKLAQELAMAYPDSSLGEFGIGSGKNGSSSSSGFNMVSSSSSGPSTRRKKENNGMLPAVFLHGKERASQFISPQKLAESKIGCGGDDQ